MNNTDTPIFTAITCVLRTKAPAVGSLRHVTELLGALLDRTTTITLAEAVAGDSGRLVDRVLRRVQLGLDSPPPDRFRTEIALGEAIREAAVLGRLGFVQRIHAVHPQPLSLRLLRQTGRNGDLPMLQWLLAHRTDGLCILHPIADDPNAHRTLSCCLRAVYYDALNYNQHHIVRWLFSQGFLQTLADAGDAAAAAGDLDMVRWVHAQDRPDSFTSGALDKAASAGHLEVVHFLITNRSEPCTIAGLNGAVNGNHDAIVSLLRTHEAVKGTEDVAATLIQAAAAGRLDIVQTHPQDGKNNRHWHYDFAMHAAAKHGHVHVLHWITTALNLQFPRGAILCAASHGQLTVLQWAHSHVGEDRWSVDVFNSAAAAGHLAVIQWLHTHRNDSGTALAMNNAAANGHFEMVQWLHTYRTEGCTTEAMNGAAANGHLTMVQWLHLNRHEGCTNEAMDGAASNGHFEIVKWLHLHRIEGCTTSAMDGAAQGGHLPIILFLHEYRHEGCSWQAGVMAAIHRHAVIVDWLREKYPLVFDAARVAEAEREL